MDKFKSIRIDDVDMTYIEASAHLLNLTNMDIEKRVEININDEVTAKSFVRPDHVKVWLDKNMIDREDAQRYAEEVGAKD